MGKVLIGFWAIWIFFVVVLSWPAPALLGCLTVGTSVYLNDLTEEKRQKNRLS